MHASGESAISGGFDHNVAVYDVLTSSVVKIFKGHTAPVTSVGSNRCVHFYNYY
jgi:WD40 repeat protein